MTRKATYILPIAFGALLSACSTQTTQEDAISLHQVDSHDTQSSVSNQRSPTTTEESAELVRLQRKLRQNEQAIESLSSELDEKESRLAVLMQDDTNGALLYEVERLRRERDRLEIQYNQMRVQNERLESRLTSLQNDEPSSRVDSKEYVELNKDFRTLENERYALSKDYRDLSIEHAQLRSQYQHLDQERTQTLAELDALTLENQQLGDALTEARIQHQALWDKVRVQSNVIDVLEQKNADLNRQGRIVAAAQSGDANNEVDQTADLQALVARLEAEINAQNKLITDYQTDVEKLTSAFEAQEERFAEESERLEGLYHAAEQKNLQFTQSLESTRKLLGERDRMVAQLEQRLERVSDERETLATRLSELQQQHDAAQKEIVFLQEQGESQAKAKTELETQVNNLIPFEGAVQSLQRQLQSELTNTRWSLPSQANLHDNFEIQFIADVDNPIEGQTYYAELIVDSAINMLSSPQAETVVDNGKISFRWRLTGLNERPNATMNIAVSQNVNYDGQRIVRQVYRDSETVELISTDWLSKYGYWGIAILSGLLVGFVAARVGTRQGANERP